MRGLNGEKNHQVGRFEAVRIPCKMDAALPLQSLPGSLSVLSCSGWVNLLYPESAGDSSIWVTIKGHKLPPPGFRFRDAVISNDS